MADNEPRMLRRTRGVLALPVRFNAFEQRQAALEAQSAALAQELRDALAEVRSAAMAELDGLRSELAAVRRLVEDRVVAEAESVAMIGKLLQRAEDRLESLERDRA